ncbi:MAG: MarR family transcriptional regulator [Siphonobacter aquaeclarae]|jgi:DNA-binding MarR family transcriptional regulator|nr:MarR family transcriptional regulator [Siphonobacter aquaeclarae]
MENPLLLKNQICFPLYALSREVIQHYRPFLDELDLTYPQYLVLMILWESQPQTVNQLGEKLLLDSGTLTPLLKRMEAKGLLTRKRKAEDERVVEISLTEAGQAMRSRAEEIPAKLMDAMGFTVEEMVELKQIVDKLLAKSSRS